MWVYLSGVTFGQEKKKKKRYGPKNNYLTALKAILKKSFIDSIITFLDDHQYVFLILSLVMTLVLYPFAIESSLASFWIHFFLSLVLLTGLYAASSHGKFLFVSIFLGVFTLLFSRIDYAFLGVKGVSLTYLISGLIFFIFVTYNLVVTMHNEEEVNSELIYGAIAGYMLIGLIGAFVYSIIATLVPGSFTIGFLGFNSLPMFIYYSFVNLTTVGYGDIVPVSHHAQSWSVLFVIAGQMYLMILIGVLVGKYIDRKASRRRR